MLKNNEHLSNVLRLKNNWILGGLGIVIVGALIFLMPKDDEAKRADPLAVDVQEQPLEDKNSRGGSDPWYLHQDDGVLSNPTLDLSDWDPEPEPEPVPSPTIDLAPYENTEPNVVTGENEITDPYELAYAEIESIVAAEIVANFREKFTNRRASATAPIGVKTVISGNLGSSDGVDGPAMVNMDPVEREIAEANAMAERMMTAELEMMERLATGSGGSAGEAVVSPGLPPINGNADFVRTAGSAQAPDVIFGVDRPLSPYEVKEGTLIPGILITGINSDLPGSVLAHVSENVYDTARGRHVLIPHGTRLIGTYNSDVAIGQERALVVWNRMIFPDGSSIQLQGMLGSDSEGYSGFSDLVDNHTWKIVKGVALMSFLGGSAAVATNAMSGDYNTSTDEIDRPTTASTFARETGNTASEMIGQVMAKKVEQDINLQPTIKIRPGYRFNIMVNKDIVFPKAWVR